MKARHAREIRLGIQLGRMDDQPTAIRLILGPRTSWLTTQAFNRAYRIRQHLLWD